MLCFMRVLINFALLVDSWSISGTIVLTFSVYRTTPIPLLQLLPPWVTVLHPGNIALSAKTLGNLSLSLRSKGLNTNTVARLLNNEEIHKQNLWLRHTAVAALTWWDPQVSPLILIKKNSLLHSYFSLLISLIVLAS